MGLCGHWTPQMVLGSQGGLRRCALLSWDRGWGVLGRAGAYGLRSLRTGILVMSSAPRRASRGRQRNQLSWLRNGNLFTYFCPYSQSQKPQKKGGCSSLWRFVFHPELSPSLQSAKLGVLGKHGKGSGNPSPGFPQENGKTGSLALGVALGWMGAGVPNTPCA
jgi:hypothetical protein